LPSNTGLMTLETSATPRSETSIIALVGGVPPASTPRTRLPVRDRAGGDSMLSL